MFIYTEQGRVIMVYELSQRSLELAVLQALGG